MKRWLLQPEVAEAMQAAWNAGMAPTAEEQLRYARGFQDDSEPRSLRRVGDVAEIRIEGVLTPKPDLFARLFGGGNTTYSDLEAAFSMAQTNTAVKRIAVLVSSPGGTVEGLFELLDTIRGVTKPIDVTASLAASGAYAIAAVSGPITATTPAAEFGSIGVAARFLVFPEIVDIASTDAPKKRPDVTTEEGKAVVREILDEIHELFVEAIARGRSANGRRTNARDVNENFGQGGTMLAANAKSRGMIDKILKPTARRGRVAYADDVTTMLCQALEGQPDVAEALRETAARLERASAELNAHETDDPEAASPGDENTTAAGGGPKPTRKTMTKEELKAQHPELYAAVFEDGKTAGQAEGEQAGVAKERKRVVAHLKLGESSGAMKLAHESIASGVSSMDEEVFAAYQSAAMNRRDANARAADDQETAAALEGAAAAPEKDLGDQVVAALEAQGGA